MKVFAKVNKNQDYNSINIANAVKGFELLGVEILKYTSLEEIMPWVSRDDIVLDGIYQIDSILYNKFNIIPDTFNYPKEMEQFLGRKIWKDTINNINTHPELWGCFVKPIKEKVFTGRVTNSITDLVGCGSAYENYEVLCSEVLDIKREFRGFVRYDKLVGLIPYLGSWEYNYDVDTVKEAMEAFKEWEERPMGCSVDFGVTSDGKTVLIEVNDGYALGCYGLNSLDYAKLISARWAQLLNRPDDFILI